MLGLIVVVLLALYLVLLLWATRTGYRWAKQIGWSKRRCRVAAAGGFLIVYLPMFWDWIPTLAANKYYCATEAGLKVYKSVEQWKTDNFAVAENLSWKDVPDSITLPDGTRRSVLNQRFVSDTRKYKPIEVLSTTITEEVIRDIETRETLATYVMVGSGYGNPVVGGQDWRVLKFWLQGRCAPMRTDFVKFEKTVWRLGKKK